MIFTTSSHAKWILTGEHAVLRGYPAIVFPEKKFSLHLTYTEAKTAALSFEPANTAIEMGLRSLFDDLLSEKKLPPLQGKIHIENTIPIGKGWGFSAAVSCVFAKLLQQLGANEPLFHLAKSIEDHFHGKSSGLDVFGCLNDQPVVFTNGQGEVINPIISPRFELIDSGPAAMSSECIQRVNTLLTENPQHAKRIDQQMAQATSQALAGLTCGQIADVQQGMLLAADCFSQWGLINESMARKIQVAYENGAIACKPTGAGLGGMILALYPPS